MALSRVSLVNSLLNGRLSRISHIKIARISTSDKSKDTLPMPKSVFPKEPPPPPKTVEEFADTKNPKSWISYGYNYEDYKQDRLEHKWVSFIVITYLLCGGGFIMWYAPDTKDKDWAYREARLLLHYREKNGLPLIDKNFIDPSKIELPSDEELGDTEIIL